MEKNFCRRMIVIFAVLVLVLGISTATKAAPAIKIVTAHSSQKELGDLTELLAWEAIKSKGYDVEFKSLATPELATQALINRDAQFSAISSGTGMMAVQAGTRSRWSVSTRRTSGHW